MKKLLLTLAGVAALSFGAYAQSESFNVNDATDINGTFTEETKKDDGSVQAAAHYQPLVSFTLGDYKFEFSTTSDNASSQPAYYYATSTSTNQQKTVRIYNGTTMKVTAPAGVTMSKIEFTGSNLGNNAAFTVDNGSWTTNNNAVWTGSANSISVTANASWRFSTLKIYTDGEPEPEVPVEPADVYTVAQALAMIADGTAPDSEVSVKGFISNIQEISTSYGNATYTIVDEGSTNGLLIYRGYWLDGAKFTATDQLAVGAEIVVSGKLVNYNGTYEMTTGSKVLSYTYEGGEEPEPEVPVDPDTVFSVAQALAMIADGTAPATEVSVKGFISSIDEISTSYGNATYDIVDKGQTDALKIYRGYWLDGAKFTATDQLAVGAEIVVSGKLVNYNGTYEMTTGSKVLSYTYEGGGEEPEQPEQPGEGDDDKDAIEVTFDFANNSYGETVFDSTNSSGYSEVGTILTEGAVSLEINPTETGSGCRFWGGSNQTFRVMKSSSIRLFVGEGKEIKNVTFVGGKLAAGDEAAANSWSGSANSILFTNTTGSTVSLTALTVKYVTETSAQLIEVENAPVEYFNLQGVRVANPENGLYIRRQGSNVTKVLVK